MKSDNFYLYQEFVSICLKDEQCLASALTDILPCMILDPCAAEIYSAIVTVVSSGKEPDIINISNLLMQQNISVSGLFGLMDGYLSSVKFPNICEEIKNRYNKHCLKKIANNLFNKLDKNEVESIDDAIAEFQEQTLQIQKTRTAKTRHISQILPECIYEMEHFDPSEYLMFGISDIDNITGGIEDGAFVVIGAEPSVGKSALAMVFGLNISAGGHAGLIFSAEMKDKQYVRRMLATTSRVNLLQIKTNSVSIHDSQSVYNAADELMPYPIYINDDSVQTIANIEAEIQLTNMILAREKKRLKYILLDHLQICEGPGITRNDVVSTITRHAKRIAKKYSLVFIALSQFSKSDNAEPRMNNLRDSKMISADADVVMLLTRPDYEKRSTNLSFDERNKLSVHINKSRDGATGVIDLVFIKEKMIIRGMEKPEYNNH